MAGAYKYRPQYTQNTVGPSPEEAPRTLRELADTLADMQKKCATATPLLISGMFAFSIASSAAANTATSIATVAATSIRVMMSRPKYNTAEPAMIHNH